MNVANKLTVGRLGLTAAFLAAIFWNFPFSNTCALALFLAASITDYLDGKIARSRQLITDFGILMDPLADKILTCSAFIAFVGREQVAAWMVVIIVARELAITGLRLLAASKQVVLAAEGYGKHKTLSQIIAIISVLVMISYPEWGKWGPWLFESWVPTFTELAKWVAVLLTLSSGALYLTRNRSLFMKDI
ncbi:MAG: CDP-diacylglycerol--glycerol-3-phosphate 3-phosphatidyltransferase [Verrucomicrobia bacterium]|nr:CDP-diacylglycerol--glycerol-3-phosphate 3-phosphatidyltransferase [Verrucomicrobiota bacterium]